ncbi:hypothetical protein [Nocardioides sp. URHA0032]|uniref:hypothetical protein n=1 Tax=Nocardioides sp. URHA0032 TaxID=1380388 RepID=UPI000ADCA2D4|nr:hypothetical protein [Nocardioides sp. URHA0032]
MPEPDVSVTYRDLHAIHDHMSKTLRVDGTAVIRGGGIAVSVLPSEVGFNPQMLMLTLRFTVTGESPSEQRLHHLQPWLDDGIQYTEVGFVGEGVPAELPDQLRIEDVH